mgnify:CR=1 FL=1
MTAFFVEFYINNASDLLAGADVDNVLFFQFKLIHCLPSSLQFHTGIHDAVHQVGKQNTQHAQQRKEHIITHDKRNVAQGHNGAVTRPGAF